MICLYDILMIPKEKKKQPRTASVRNSAQGKKWDSEAHLKT